MLHKTDFIKFCFFFVFIITSVGSVLAQDAQVKVSSTSKKTESMAFIEAGSYRPLYLSKESPFEKVEAFYIDKLPVTNQSFYEFVTKNPQWQKNKTARIFVENNYLSHWKSSQKKNDTPDKKDFHKPVVNVSWFAAQAYCNAYDKRLPTVAEWEYVASASENNKLGNTDPNYNQKILAWYSQPNSREIADVNQSPANFWGVSDLHALIWEWTEDFNSALVTGESRGDSSLDKGLFCGSGASGSTDPSDYAAFMRFGFRSSLQANFTIGNLGFRCALSNN